MKNVDVESCELSNGAYRVENRTRAVSLGEGAKALRAVYGSKQSSFLRRFDHRGDVGNMISLTRFSARRGLAQPSRPRGKTNARRQQTVSGRSVSMLQNEDALINVVPWGLDVKANAIHDRRRDNPPAVILGSSRKDLAQSGQRLHQNT